MSDHEIYPNAPVVLVALEARHPDAEPLSPGAQSDLKRLLADDFPLPQPAPSITMRASSEGGPEAIIEQIPRYATRDQTTAVSVGTQTLTVETTRHTDFEHLRELMHRAAIALQKVAPVAGLTRLGLRYVDEVRVPAVITEVLNWSQWVDVSLLGPSLKAEALGLSIKDYQGALVVEAPGTPGQAMVLRYGPREGFAVSPGGPLMRPTPPPGSFFLLDIDSFYAPSDIPEFDPSVIAAKADELHAPVLGLFESLITNKLRNEVLRRG